MEQMEEELSFDGDFQKEKIGPQKRFWILVLALALLTAGILVLVWLVPKQRTLPVFSEIMTSNHDEDIDLSGYGFTDEIKRTFRYRFPEGTILKSGEYLLLYCTGGTEASDADPYCTGFNLSANGEDLYLVNPHNVEVDEAHVPALEPDTSWARAEDGTFLISTVPTPGEANRFE